MVDAAYTKNQAWKSDKVQLHCTDMRYGLIHWWCHPTHTGHTGSSSSQWGGIGRSLSLQVRCWQAMLLPLVQLSDTEVLSSTSPLPHPVSRLFSLVNSLGMKSSTPLLSGSVQSCTAGFPMQVSLQLSWGGSELSTEAPLLVPLPGVPCW